jgi:uncharacterized protein (DUF2147 family)
MKTMTSPLRSNFQHKTLGTLFIASIAFLGASNAMGQNSPVGVWRTFDAGTNRPGAEVEIYATGDKLSGKILRSLRPEEQGRIDLCVKCPDERKDKPMIGLEIIRDLPLSGRDSVWEGGNILDPDNGKTYKLRVELIEEGKQLKVRGYIGPFFRTQVWERRNP